MRFSYKAIKQSGETYEAQTSSKDKRALYALLKERGETLVSAEVIDEKKKSFEIPGLGNILNRIKDEEIIQFARNLGAMLEAGLPLARALDVMTRQTRNERFSEILKGVSESIKSGQSLNESLADSPKVFSQLFISMVKAGEESGKLSDALQTIAKNLESSYKLKKRIRGALMYPSIILVAMIGVAILMLVFIVPTLSSTFEELAVELPVSTQFIISLSGFIQNQTIIFLLLIILTVTAFVMLLRNPKGKRLFELGVNKLPVVGELVRETNSARTAGTLSSLLSSGVEVIVAIEITGEVVQNSLYKEVLSELKEVVQRGESMSDVFKKHEDLYPPFVGEMVSVGEETGNLSELFGRIAVFYQNDVEERTKNLSTIIEPVLMVIIGLGVGFFAVSMISPMYSLVNAI